MSKGKERDKRVPLGEYRKEMTVPKHLLSEGYVPRWINDVGNKLDAAIKGGYEYIMNKKNVHIGEGIETGNSDLGSKISKIVDKTPRMGEPMRAYLMHIKREWYEEDQIKKMARVQTADVSITGEDGQVKKQGFYGNVQYET